MEKKESKRKGRKFGNTSPIKNGDVFVMKSGRTCTVCDYVSANNIKVIFEDGYALNLRYGTLREGSYIHPMDRTVLNIGYIGFGKYSHKEHGKAYEKWCGVLSRAYDNNFHKKRIGSAYKGTMVAKEWHNFQNFAEWFYKQEYRSGWQIDKDIKRGQISIYSPQTCLIVPRSINMAFLNNTGVCYLGDESKRRKKYQSNISIKNKKVCLGYFFTEQEANSKYLEAKRNYIIQLLDSEDMSDYLRELIRGSVNARFSGVDN